MGFDLNKFEKRIQKEFIRRQLIGDIYIKETEYDFLIEYFKNVVNVLQYDDNSKPDRIFSLALVQIGINYYDRNLWKHIDEVVGYPVVRELRKRISEKFYKTLHIYEKPYVGRNEFVKNVLMHGFVSNHYSKNFFDYLYKFYTIDLDRNLNWIGYKDALSLLVESIKDDEIYEKENLTNREYMLVDQTKQALKHLPKKSIRMRIKWLILYLDKITYDDEFNSFSKSRLINQMIDWSKTSTNKSRIDKEYGSTNRSKLIRNEYPYVKYKKSNDTFYIHVPSQRFTLRKNTEIIAWLTIGNEKTIINLGQNELSTILKTNDYKQQISFDDLFKEITLEINIANTYRKFNILNGQNIVFFNHDFESNRVVNQLQSINSGTNYIISKGNVRINSSLNLNGTRFHGETIHEVVMDENQYILVNDKDIYIVNQTLKEGLNSLNRISYINSNGIDIFNGKPFIFIKSTKEKIFGLKYTINNHSYRYDDSIIILDSLEMQSKEIQAVLNFEKKELLIGFNSVSIDFPGLNTKKYEFVYIPELNFKFIDEPYIFKYEGYIDFIESKNITSELESDSNIFKFPISKDKSFKFIYSFKDTKVEFQIEPPVLQYNNSSFKLCHTIGDIWYKNFDYNIEFKYNKYFEVVINKSETIKLKSEYYSDGFYYCSLSKLKSYFLDLENNYCSVDVLFNNQYFEFANVYLKTRIINMSSLEYDEENKLIKAKYEKIGEDKLYLTIESISSEKILCEYYELDSNEIRINSEGEAGFYKIELFTLNRGFAKTYTKIFSKKLELKTNNFVGMKFDVVSHYYGEMRFQVHKYFEKTYLRTSKQISNDCYLAQLFCKTFDSESRKHKEEKICDIQINIKDFNKYYRAEIMLIDEEDLIPLLYDKHSKKLVIDEDNSLDRKTRYSRYLYLDDVTFDLEIGD